MSDSLEDLRARVDEVFREVAADVEAIGNRLRTSTAAPLGNRPYDGAEAEAGRGPLDAVTGLAGRLRRTAASNPVETAIVAVSAATILAVRSLLKRR